MTGTQEIIQSSRSGGLRALFIDVIQPDLVPVSEDAVSDSRLHMCEFSREHIIHRRSAGIRHGSCQITVVDFSVTFRATFVGCLHRPLAEAYARKGQDRDSDDLRRCGPMLKLTSRFDQFSKRSVFDLRFRIESRGNDVVCLTITSQFILGNLARSVLRWDSDTQSRLMTCTAKSLFDI